jgi:Mg-chelatase subunit ChlI
MARFETKIRLPEELHATLTAEATHRGISLNALVTIVLTEWAGSTRRLRDAIIEARDDDGS